ncbi:MAG: hypothetical protein D6714_01055 [Bacteroidetes bacterium]|nr:MAG: hypothetical protein D6714_01055 [Bacteroidota bacterium]
MITRQVWPLANGCFWAWEKRGRHLLKKNILPEARKDTQAFLLYVLRSKNIFGLRSERFSFVALFTKMSPLKVRGGALNFG